MIKKLFILIALLPMLASNGGQVINTGNNRKIFLALTPVAGMTLWVSADCITFTSSVCGTPANGTSISSWADRSGSGFTWSKSGGTATFNTGVINSQPAVTLTAPTWGNFGTISASAGHTIFVVYAWNSGTPSGTDVIGSTANGGFSYNAPAPSAPAAIDKQQQTNVLQGTLHAAFPAWHQANGWFTNAASGLAGGSRVDKVADTLTVGPVNTDITATGPTTLFRNNVSNTNQFDGKVAEIIYYNTTLNSTQIALNEAYFAAKYGL